MWGGRRKRSAVAAEARHLGRSVWGGGHRSRHRERGPRRRGVWESTSPRSPWLRARGWGYEGCNTWAWLRLNQGQGPTSVDTPRGSPRNGAGKNDCASSLEADRPDALQRKRHESCSFSR